VGAGEQLAASIWQTNPGNAAARSAAIHRRFNRSSEVPIDAKIGQLSSPTFPEISAFLIARIAIIWD
jgi:hypothetical protein